MNLKIKHIFCLIVAFSLLCSQITFAENTATDKNNTTQKLALDGTESKWAQSELQDAYTLGLTYKDVEGNFQKPITREEFSTIAVKLYEKLSGRQAIPAANNFTDTTNVETLKAVALGIVKGTSATTFSPLRSISRQELCVMVFRALKAVDPKLDTTPGNSFPFTDTKKIAAWALDAMKYAYKQEIVKGSNGIISPNSNTSREQAIAIIKRTYEKILPQVSTNNTNAGNNSNSGTNNGSNTSTGNNSNSGTNNGSNTSTGNNSNQGSNNGSNTGTGNNSGDQTATFDEGAAFSKNRLPSLDMNKIKLNPNSFGKIVFNLPDNRTVGTIDALIKGVPAGPSDVTAVLGADNNVTVTWKDNSNNETGFDIGADDSHNNGGTNHVNANVTSWVDKNPHIAGETYFYSVSARNDSGNSGWTTKVSVKIPPKKSSSVPAAPSNLRAVWGTDDKIKLTWDDNSLDETGFEVEIDDDMYGGGNVVKLPSNCTSYIEDGPHASGDTYECTVNAYNDIGRSPISNKVYVKTPVTVVPADFASGLTAVLGTDNKVTLEWNYHYELEDGFEIKMRSTRDNAVTTKKVTGNGTGDDSYVDDREHIPGQTYYYSISAYNKIGNSKYTKEVSVKIPETTKLIGALKDSDVGLAGLQSLGKGYNIITGKYADIDSLKDSVLDINRLLHDGYVVKLDNNKSESEYISGRTIQEYSQRTSTSIGLEGGYLCFKASLNANFSSSSLSRKENSFATLRYLANLYNLNVDTQHSDLKKYLDNIFTTDIDHMDPQKLFEKYGTHVVTSIKVGGHLDYSANSSNSTTSNSSSTEYSMRASFNSMFASGGISVSTHTENTNTTKTELYNTNIKGFPAYGATDVNPGNFKEWFEYMKKNPGFSGFGNANPLRPIWELASTKARQDELHNAFMKYADSYNFIQPDTIMAITGISLRKMSLALRQKNYGIPETYIDPQTGDTWYEVANIAAHTGQEGEQVDILYVKQGWSNNESQPPVVGMFFVNEDQKDDAMRIFKELYGDDPTAKLWGRGANEFPGGNLYISNIPGSKHMLFYYVTSMKRNPITNIRIKYIETNGTTTYFPNAKAGEENLQYSPILDMTDYLFDKSFVKEQNCDEGAVNSYNGLKVWNRHFIEFSTGN